MGLIKMGSVLVIFKIMPESIDTDLSKIESNVKKAIEGFGGVVGKIEKEPIAFGLVSLRVSCSLNEKNSNLDPLEDQLRNLDGVVSVEVVDVRRAIG